MSLLILSAIGRASIRLIYNQKWLLVALILLFSAFLTEYLYLNNLYLIDDLYDITGPKEYSLEEKFTLRTTIWTRNQRHAIQFVAHYSQCCNVMEIQLFWPNSSVSSSLPPPDDIFFDYPRNDKTMAIHIHPLDRIFSLDVNTEAILSLDIDSFISCDSLTFMHSVWRSAKTSAGVGPFPRLLATSSSSYSSHSLYNFKYTHPIEVWLQNRYNLIHPAAVFQHRSIVQVLSLSLLSLHYILIFFTRDIMRIFLPK